MSSGAARPVIRTPDQRLRVFVSSTLQELADERAAAQEAIARLRLAPVLFDLGARPHPPRDLYCAYLDQSHIGALCQACARMTSPSRQALKCRQADGQSRQIPSRRWI